ncbi:MAG: hypothetical protein CNIPEHKO_01853 [Anaerolineales bacterium]|nr:hypothetical protein [Anaerolineales bacterium]
MMIAFIAIAQFKTLQTNFVKTIDTFHNAGRILRNMFAKVFAPRIRRSKRTSTIRLGSFCLNDGAVSASAR